MPDYALTQSEPEEPNHLWEGRKPLADPPLVPGLCRWPAGVMPAYFLAEKLVVGRRI